MFSSLLLVVFISMIILIKHWNQNKGVVYLVILIIATSLRQMTLLVLYSKGSADFIVYIYTYWDAIFALIGPCLYYYFRSIIKGKIDYSPFALIHLIPFLLILINSIPYYALPLAEKIDLINFMRNGSQSKYTSTPYLFFQGKTQKIFFMISNFSYAAYSLYYAYQFKFKGSQILRKKVSVLLSKAVIVCMITILTYFLLAIYYYYQIHYNASSYVFNQSHFLVLLIFPLSFFLFPSWLYGENENPSIFSRFNHALKITFSDSLKKEGVDSSTANLDRIIAYISDSKPYLKDTFSLHDISRALNIPHVRVTNCFNKQLQVSFPVYRNKLRIDYAISLFTKGAHLNTSIEGIASKSGFKSKSAFYLAFKAEHGVTPIEWIKENL